MSAAPLIPIASLRRIALAPGEVLAISVDHELTADEAMRFREQVRAALPAGIRAIILEPGWTPVAVFAPPHPSREIGIGLTDKSEPCPGFVTVFDTRGEIGVSVDPEDGSHP